MILEDESFASERPETHDQWQHRMALEVLKVTRSELFMDFRYLDMALSALKLTPFEGVRGMGTDCERLLAEPERLLRLSRVNPVLINREYLHNVLHCLFRHPFLIGEHEPALWNLACDIAVESIIDGFEQKSVRRIATLVRRRAYEKLKQHTKVLAAEPICRLLETGLFDESELIRLQRDFRTDDHRFWPQPQQQDQPRIQALSQQWKKIGDRMKTELETHSKDAGESDGEPLKVQVEQSNRNKRTYAEFLRRFAVLREELHADPDNFDLNYYTYGLSLYGNMPLIEPLESREAKKIEDFVIVIDTSYSCSGELVKAFLRETYGLLKQTESFFRSTNIRILQCDDAVRSDCKISNEQDLQKYMFSFQVIGGGGTDFRPAFAHVEKLLEQGEFTHLKGLLYFTDGMGIYPGKRPAYDTAFLFIGDRFEDADRPPWAMKLVLDPDELMPKEKSSAAEAITDAFDPDWDEEKDEMPML